jgi:hypothetical protein
MTHNVLLSYGRKDAQAAPSRPRLPPLRSLKSQAREGAAHVAGRSFIFCRVQRRGWFAGKDGF